MTRKHFEALARSLKFAHPSVTRPADAPDSTYRKIAEAAWRESVAAVADACKISNPRFDREKFYEACGGGI